MAKIEATYQKSASATVDFELDWSKYLGGDTIATSTWTAVTAGITIGTMTNTTTKATVWLSGGTDGTTYRVRNSITTAGGRTDQRDLKIYVSTLATYDLTTTLGKVRLHINDTDVNNPKLTDEEINYALTENGGTLAPTVIYCIHLLMAQLMDPTFTADWLTIDSSTAYKSYERLLQVKSQQLGVSTVTVRTVYPYRADSNQTAQPDWSTDHDIDSDGDID